MQHVLIGPRQRSFHRQLLASRAFETLPDDHQTALAALPAPVRRQLFDVWEPEGANADDAFGTTTHLEPLADNALFLFERALHAARPDVALQAIFSEDSAQVLVSRGLWHMHISGFDRHGDVASDLTVVTGDITDEHPRIVTLSDLNIDELVAAVLAPSGGSGTDFVSNSAKGKWAANSAFPLGTDALVVDLWKSAGLEADSTLKDRVSLNDVTAGTSATTVKADATNYARKVAASVTLTIDNTNDWITGDFADITWTALGGGTNNTIAKLSVAYRPASGSAETAIVPQTFHSFDVTTDGSDLTATVTNFARAS